MQGSYSDFVAFSVLVQQPSQPSVSVVGNPAAVAALRSRFLESRNRKGRAGAPAALSRISTMVPPLMPPPWEKIFVPPACERNAAIAY